ncbi:nuclease-related domain-containing protein [Alicyclobacillus sp. ALC3]|uniref:nuclease-related domain-containing protein n=1 Tax=Alicyclobacillus sp. ALC3 TaxID=2796143 RepID=UPI0023788D38|nr:nuclease-related domain-containing protein [Alicyclobacillus sp. ALC3]WDL97763.1 NERD domain-containing protein [Alicyclobacillus sp. ALC3]
MILKNADDKLRYIEQLEKLREGSDEETKPRIERELRMLRAGAKGEEEAAYLINFHYGALDKTAVIHDLRIEVGGRVAQIDHLIIHRTLNVFVLESKHFHAGVKISDDGEFLMWNQYRRAYEGMASPLEQNDRHIEVLKEAFAAIDMPTRVGMRLSPVFHSYVLVSSNARIKRPEKLDTSKVIKADMLSKTIDSQFDKTGFFGVLGNASRIISEETLRDIGGQLIALHKPAQFDYAGRFKVAGNQTDVQASLVKHQCRNCGSENLSIQHGRYGYYFKCAACEGNTPIKIGCGQVGHKERLRKEGLNFYRECAECGTSSPYYVNPI